MYPASFRCFYCSNPVNPDGRHVEATIEHLYKSGDTRMTDRRFHPPCFQKFKVCRGRPYNPQTEYQVVAAETVTP